MPVQADRRQLLRTGMWAVPVIAVATAAPAFAVSGADLSKSTMAVNATGSGANRETTVSVNILNSGQATTSLLSVRIKFNTAAPAGQVAPSGWTVAIDPLDATSLIYTSNSQVAGNNGSLAVTFVLKVGNNSTTAIVSLNPGGNGTGKSFPSTAV